MRRPAGIQVRKYSEYRLGAPEGAWVALIEPTLHTQAEGPISCCVLRPPAGDE